MDADQGTINQKSGIVHTLNGACVCKKQRKEGVALMLQFLQKSSATLARLSSIFFESITFGCT